MGDPNRKSIYLDDAIDAVNELTKWYWETYHETRPTDTAVINRLTELPSAQPEIIRCKDCKWSDFYTSTDGKRYCYCMETGASGRTADDFCSYAERRTDAETEV